MSDLEPPPPPPPPSPDTADPGTDAGTDSGTGLAAGLPEVPHQLSDRVEGLTCPNCGGTLDVASGLRVVFCEYCRTPLLVSSEVGIRRFAVEPRIGADRAREVARQWLVKGMRKDPKLRREAKLGETLLCFLPFFRVTADCLGVALGTELRRRTVGAGKHRRVETYEVDVERKVTRSHDRTYPAVDVSEWGIQRVQLAGDPLVPFDTAALSRLGMVFEPTGSEIAAFNAAIRDFREATDPAAGLKKVRFRFLETVRERLSVIYYPLWIVRYHYRQRAYQILVDAEDGTLAYGKAPGNDFFRAAVLVVAEAAAMFVATTAIQLADQGCLAVAAVFGIGLSIVLWGWKHFRYGGVVIEGTGVVPGGKPGRFERAARQLRGGPGAELRL
ncbi:MAG: hypothetical protein ACE5GX_19290 [Thermoanaerobaculia bacterium]